MSLELAHPRGFLRQLSEAQGTSLGAVNKTTAIGRWTWSTLLMAMPDPYHLIAGVKKQRVSQACFRSYRMPRFKLGALLF
jgi:hypothetical protein